MAKKDGTKSGGRVAGTPNKKTTQLLELFDMHDFCPGESLLKLVRDEEKQQEFIPQELANIYLKLMEFKFPRRKAVEHTGKDGEDLFGKLLDDLGGKK